MNPGVVAAPVAAPSAFRIRAVEPVALELPLGRPVANPIMAFSSSVALLVRGYVYWGRPYLPGIDYGQAVLQARLYLEGGALPDKVPYFQLGQTDWAPLPGVSMLFAALASLAGDLHA